MAEQEQSDNVWRVRDMDPHVRKQIKMYALQHEMTVAQALKELVSLALLIVKK